jgi:hypothetical protein
MKTIELTKMLKDLYLQNIDELHCQFYETSCFSPDKKIIIVNKIEELTDQFIKDIVESLLPSDEEIDKERCELYPGEGEINDSKFSAFGKGSRWLRNEILNKLSNGETAKING